LAIGILILFCTFYSHIGLKHPSLKMHTLSETPARVFLSGADRAGYNAPPGNGGIPRPQIDVQTGIPHPSPLRS